MIKSIKEFLSKYNLLNPENTYIVGFSGGWDSMCLLDNLYEISLLYKFRLVGVHLNHGWRNESDEEEEVCRKFCQVRQIDFYSEKMPKTCPKTETAAREYRYKFFNECLNKFNADAIFTAHNFDDNAETVLYRICKGTGVSGLIGIAEKRGKIYRPLINVTREDIEKYDCENNLIPNSDSSNNDEKYKRNYIRHTVLPSLLKINNGVKSALNTLSEVAKNDCDVIEEYLKLVNENLKDERGIKFDEYKKLSSSVKKRIIYNVLQENKLEYDFKKIERIFDFLEIENNSKISLTTNLWLLKTEKYILIERKEIKNDFSVIVKECGKYKIPNTEWIFEIKPFLEEMSKFPDDTDNTAYIKIDNVDFVLRNRQDGDYIYPLGMNMKKQKLKKYLTNKKILPFVKNKLILLTQGKNVLWVASVGLSEKIKVDRNVTHVISLYKG